MLDLDAQMQHPAERLVVEAVERGALRPVGQRLHRHVERAPIVIDQLVRR